MAVSWINNSGLGNLEHSHLIYDIRSLLCSMGQANVKHSFRVTNSFADLLAKNGARGERDVLSWSLS